MQAGSDPTTSALLGGALNATVSNRVEQIVWRGKSVKIDPCVCGDAGQLDGADYGAGAAIEAADGDVCDECEPERAAADPGAVRPDPQYLHCGDTRRVRRIQRRVQAAADDIAKRAST